MTKHYVKSWAHFFDAISAGKKLHDLRKLDRDYKVGDTFVLQRYDNINGAYTGEELETEITYITSSQVPCAFSSSALDKNYGILSIKVKPSVKPVYDHHFIPSDEIDRTPKIVMKGPPNYVPEFYATGGPVKAGKPYLVGERLSEYVTADGIKGVKGNVGVVGTKSTGRFANDYDDPHEHVGQYRG